MSYKVMIVADANVVRFWDAVQLARPQMVGVSLRPVSCLDTLSAALSDINDGIDYALVSVLTTLLLEEASASDVRASSYNIIRDVVKRVVACAKKSGRVEVYILLSMLIVLVNL